MRWQLFFYFSISPSYVPGCNIPLSASMTAVKAQTHAKQCVVRMRTKINVATFNAKNMTVSSPCHRFIKLKSLNIRNNLNKRKIRTTLRALGRSPTRLLLEFPVVKISMIGPTGNDVMRSMKNQFLKYDSRILAGSVINSPSFFTIATLKFIAQSVQKYTSTMMLKMYL